mgnify:CR=1 FL=1
MVKRAILVLAFAIGCAPTSGVDPNKSGEFSEAEIRALCRFQADLLGDVFEGCGRRIESGYEVCLEGPPHIAGNCGWATVGAFEECVRALASGDCEHPSCLLPLCL